jgi:hypothetical protein
MKLEERVANRLKIEINKSYYIYKRYNLESAFAILYHEKPIHVSELGKMVRISDHLLKIDENHYFINFLFTNHTDAFKAAQNLIFALDNHFNNTTSVIALDTFDVSQPIHLVLSRLQQILLEIQKNSYCRIDDENILNELF